MPLGALDPYPGDQVYLSVQERGFSLSPRLLLSTFSTVFTLLAQLCCDVHLHPLP